MEQIFNVIGFALTILGCTLIVVSTLATYESRQARSKRGLGIFLLLVGAMLTLIP